MPEIKEWGDDKHLCFYILKHTINVCTKTVINKLQINSELLAGCNKCLNYLLCDVFFSTFIDFSIRFISIFKKSCIST